MLRYAKVTEVKACQGFVINFVSEFYVLSPLITTCLYKMSRAGAMEACKPSQPHLISLRYLCNGK